MRIRHYASVPVLAVTGGLYAAWLAYPIAIVTADIGRHIISGSIFFRQPELFWKLTHTNFFTYSHPDYPFINHHWLSGVFFYFMEKTGGWQGLHIMYILMLLLALGLCIDAARRVSSLWTASVVALAALPLIDQRTEIRPEGFAYLIVAVMLWILIASEQGAIARSRRWFLPVLLLFWTNMHASFPVGLALILLFASYEIYRARGQGSSVTLAQWGIPLTCILAVFVNPNGVYGVLQPFLIFRDAGYAVVENQSVFFLEKLGMYAGPFFFLKAWMVLLVLGGVLLVRSKKATTAVPLFLFTIALGCTTFFASRHISALGFVLAVAAAAILKHITDAGGKRTAWIATGLVALLAAVSFGWHVQQLSSRWIVIGLAPRSTAAAKFLKENSIHGPLFNNFDIAGYLIHEFYPEERVFVSNVPEAHPPEFFRDVYIPMQQDEAVWQQQLAQNNFNAIVLYYHDRTQWLQQFLKTRIYDPTWAPVYVDDSVLVLLRRNEKNQDLITKHGIPSTAFTFGQ
ncbi:hypothetical protein FJZ28_05035 [Candidatus Peregrinibacteria bacterium]|nr:hypothetical protein [Candidatus Peregrinibacteria bacterium]